MVCNPDRQMAARVQDEFSFLQEMKIKPRVLNGRIIQHTDQEEGLGSYYEGITETISSVHSSRKGK